MHTVTFVDEKLRKISSQFYNSKALGVLSCTQVCDSLPMLYRAAT